MKEEKSNFTNDEYLFEISLEELLSNDKYKKCLKDKSYQDYLKGNADSTETKIMMIDFRKLEDVFQDELSYMAMKDLSEIEKFAIYVIAFRKEHLDRLCSDCKISKKRFVNVYKNGTNHFKKNLSKYTKKGYKTKLRKNYKKGGAYNG